MEEASQSITTALAWQNPDAKAVGAVTLISGLRPIRFSEGIAPTRSYLRFRRMVEHSEKRPPRDREE
jgi:hypothetical protein